MYSVSGYGAMIADRVRVDAHARALRQAIRPGSVVADIGTGIGFFAVLACQCGARRVYAIEPDDAIEVARAVAAANGCAERIDFFQDLSTRITLPEPVDVIVSDLRGVLPLFQRHIPSIIDARKRFLAPGGQLISRRDTLLAAVISAGEAYRRCTSPWEDRSYGIDMTAGRRVVTNLWSNRRVKAEQVVLPPRSWATLDYSMVTDPSLSGSITWTAESSATAHGLLVWFDAVLSEEVTLSNAPSEPDLIYGRAFFPWTHPVALDAGDSVTVTISANFVGDDYVWRWDTQVIVPGRPERPKASFRQSTFYGALLSAADLRRQRSDFVPTLTEDGQIDGFILSLMDGGRSLGEIAERATARFPLHFADVREALTRVSRLSLTYSQRSQDRARPLQ